MGVGRHQASGIGQQRGREKGEGEREGEGEGEGAEEEEVPLPFWQCENSDGMSTVVNSRHQAR